MSVTLSIAARLATLAVVAALLSPSTWAAEATVAVAANFATTARQLANEFAAHSTHEVRVIPGSTGKLYAQIVNGAPFDILLAADAERPRRLEADGHAVAGTRRTYAVGRLVAWSRDPAFAGRDCIAVLRESPAARIAIAKPEVAPYGAAAREYLESAGFWTTFEARIVYGENVAQTLQFAVSGGASVAFVAAAQLRDTALPPAACEEELPAGSHAPIEQQVVLLQRAADNAAALAFLAFLESPAGRARIQAAGYTVPDR